MKLATEWVGGKKLTAKHGREDKKHMDMGMDLDMDMDLDLDLLLYIITIGHFCTLHLKFISIRNKYFLDDACVWHIIFSNFLLLLLLFIHSLTPDHSYLFHN